MYDIIALKLKGKGKAIVFTPISLLFSFFPLVFQNSCVYYFLSLYGIFLSYFSSIILLVTNSFIFFFHLSISWFPLYSWKIFLFDIEIWIDGQFLSVLGKCNSKEEIHVNRLFSLQDGSCHTYLLWLVSPLAWRSRNAVSFLSHVSTDPKGEEDFCVADGQWWKH